MTVNYWKVWISAVTIMTTILVVTSDDNSEEIDIRDNYDGDNHNNPDVIKHLEDIREDTSTNSIPEKDLPKFGEPLQNVTIPVGREAILQCIVDNLQTYKIAWLRVDTQTILTIQNHVITKNHRMSITHAEKRAWILKIKDVKESDKGWYMCQINTDPMKSQVGYLDVVVPPDILDYPTSTDMVVREGSNVTLRCAATGSPTPTITWRREGSEQITLPSGQEVISFNGSVLTIARVNRLSMGAYLCIASNGIPPTVSKRVMLIVHFPPMIWIQNQLVGAAIGQTITLECQSEAFPKSINYWMKNDTIIVPGDRFVPEAIEKGYKVVMRITVKNVEISDFGSYKCVAKNSLGDTDGAIKLYHIPHTTPMTTVAPTAPLATIAPVQKSSNYRDIPHTTPMTTVAPTAPLATIAPVQKSSNYRDTKLRQKPTVALMPILKNDLTVGSASSWNSAEFQSKERHNDKNPKESGYRSDGSTSTLQRDSDHLTNNEKSSSKSAQAQWQSSPLLLALLLYAKYII